MIQVENLTRRYGDFTAVDDVSFSIGRGEIVGLLGHNGAGKTTIMKMLTGFLEPTAGTIDIDGLLIGRDTTAIQSRIGYLPENCPVWPEMTVIDYLDYQANLHGLPEEQRTAAVARAIRRTALKEKATSTIQTLSRGYRQRVGVAQAILHEPDIVILDEPTNGLDPTQIRQMRDLIRELAQTATIMVSTHILQEVQAVCERVLILRAGRLVVDSRLDELQRDGALLMAVEGDAEKALNAVDGVEQVSELDTKAGQRRYRVKAQPGSAPRVAQAVMNAGLALHEITTERHDLETVFAQVNEEVGHG
ncbi:MAG: multidrug ABC transporter ATP-binding protein [Candidatus Sedimenticola endophacoides]|uniref:Multidrug ABC transporter ATP-binding protein n=1 Tax=Candidatus Sedimenticola endophacoides TaxID=2548426 RepID=A0A657PVH7_9GAMM|nr:MAG: multidrug ABC transporter ATP-binding protein [Candidatus Sedimenticola endophacoides]OQX32809.1 MAG: multidrug ABC transporter ATP-binding protein [Candidatus Sedimenticola endophacoides]OQX38491.1 MAG: multidrug ABC transporter ATP-binding protein [Candidatus Sedimenticola endophacoides]OQX45933.1 MAG: multidrug ABC transporter ATP-binding protein [Candidatus Sedimenticola endophacoides]OQX48922.1 MAG: multidrug ABC transporter ATP-binding protein [Candidatus Sedimenticola endophacoid